MNKFNTTFKNFFGRYLMRFAYDDVDKSCNFKTCFAFIENYI